MCRSKHGFHGSFRQHKRTHSAHSTRVATAFPCLVSGCRRLRHTYGWETRTLRSSTLTRPEDTRYDHCLCGYAINSMESVLCNPLLCSICDRLRIHQGATVAFKIMSISADAGWCLSTASTTCSCLTTQLLGYTTIVMSVYGNG